MQVITPTPSQAAVAMKKFFARQGIEVKLSQAQEAIAVSQGYASWNALAAAVPVRGKPVAQAPAAGERIDAPDGLQLWAITGRVSGDDDDSLYLCWGLSQAAATEVARAQLQDDGGLPDDEDEDADQLYIICSQQVGHIEEGRFVLAPDMLPSVQEARVGTAVKVDPALPAPTLEHFIDQSAALARDGVKDGDARLLALHAELEDALAATGMLSSWTRQSGRDERCMEEQGAYIQVSYDLAYSDSMATELVFTLRDDFLRAYVRTWEFKNARDYAIFREHTGDFDTDAPEPDPDQPLTVLVGNALKEAREHKAKLRETLGLD